MIKKNKEDNMGITFKIVENSHGRDLSHLRDDFEMDYICSGLSVNSLIRKYGLSRNEYYELAREVREKYNISSKPRAGINKDLTDVRVGKNYKKCRYGYQIHKTLNQTRNYIGTVPSEEIAKKMIDVCEEIGWDIPKCKQIVRNWSDYV